MPTAYGAGEGSREGMSREAAGFSACTWLSCADSGDGTIGADCGAVWDTGLCGRPGLCEGAVDAGRGMEGTACGMLNGPLLGYKAGASAFEGMRAPEGWPAADCISSCEDCGDGAGMGDVSL